MNDFKKQRINDGEVTDRPWASAVILLLSAGYFSIAADLPHVTVFTALLLGAGFFAPTAWRVNDRTMIYSAVAALALTAIGNYLWPTRNDRFGFLAFFLRPMLLVPFSLYCAALLTGFRRRSLSLAVAAAAAFFTFAAGGDLYGNMLSAERIPGLENCGIPLRDFYVFMLALVGAVVLYSLRGGRRITILILIGIVALFSWGEVRLYLRYEQPIRQLENRILRFGISQIRNPGDGKIELGNTAGNLNMPFFSPDEAAGSRIILRATGGTGAPGYLRSQSFRHYRNGSWHNPSPELKQPLEVVGAENPLHADQTFLLPDGTRTGTTLRIYPDSRLAGKPILLPDGSGALEMIAESAEISSGGKISAETMLPDGGYLVWKNPEFALPGDAAPEHFRELPEELQGRFSAIAEELKLSAFPSDRERVQALRHYFDTQFSYSLDWPGGGGDDPTLVFLEKIRRGHCELFASGAVLLLRAAGVPARYVTGVVCFEPRSGGRYYVARLRNAHAWSEYFDREAGRWLRFDATPDSVAAPPGNGSDVLKDAGETLQFRWQELFGAFRRGHATAAIAAFGFFLVRYGWPVFLLFWLYRYYRRRPRMRFRLDAGQRRAQRKFFELIRQLRKRGVELPPEPSAEEILPFLSEESERQFVREYQKQRFKPGVPARR